MSRILRDTESEIRVTVTHGGVATAADSPPTVTITRDSDGETIAEDEAATEVENETGVYVFTIAPADIPEVDLLRAVWTATVDGTAGQEFRTEVEVVGGFLCSLEAIDDALPSSITKTTAERASARQWAEEKIENPEACDVAFVPRYARETRNGRGKTDLVLANARPRRILAGTLDGADVSGAVELENPGVAYLEAGWSTGRSNVSLAYEHGYETPPQPVVEAAVKLARHHLVPDPSNYDERATRIDTDDASYMLVTAGVRGAMTPIPEVNQVIEDFREERFPLVA